MTASCSTRSQCIEPFHVMSILAKAQALQAKGHDVIHLEVGEPDFPAPEAVIHAGIEALRAGKTHYTPALGLPELRRAIAQYYQTTHNVRIDPHRVILAPGASGVLQLLCAARLDVGERLLLTDPGYPCNRHFARLFEAHGQCIAVDASSRYQLTPNHIDEHWQQHTKAVLLASPSNPTGSTLSSEQFLALNQRIKAHQGELWVDEIYQGLVFDQPAYTVLKDIPDAVVINSFSKYFSMTGFRLGWGIVPEHWVDTLDTLAQNLFLAPSTPSQYAALAAFEPESIETFERQRQELKERRDYLVGALTDLGFDVPIMPDGALYVYADASRFTQDSMAFCQDLLEKAHVAVTPGIDFGEHLANQHIRFAFTVSCERLEQAMKRLKHYLQDR